jgi:cobalt/nickel transport system permease protein
MGAYVSILFGWLVVITAGALVGISPLRLARRGAIALPFVLAAVPVIFLRTDELLWSGSVGPLSLSISGAGLRIALTAVLKAWVSVQASIVLITYADAPTIVTALRRMKLPDAIATSAGLTIRYLELLRDEARRMLRARTARCPCPPPRAAGRL